MAVRTLLAHNNFGSHVAALTGNTKVLSIRSNIIVVANQNITGLRIDEKVAVVQVLIAVSLVMKLSESVGTPWILKTKPSR